MVLEDNSEADSWHDVSQKANSSNFDQNHSVNAADLSNEVATENKMTLKSERNQNTRQ